MNEAFESDIKSRRIRPGGVRAFFSFQLATREGLIVDVESINDLPGLLEPRAIGSASTRFADFLERSLTNDVAIEFNQFLNGYFEKLQNEQQAQAKKDDSRLVTLTDELMTGAGHETKVA